MKKLISLILLSFIVTSCGEDVQTGPVHEDSTAYPLANKYDRRRERGSLLQGGSWFFGDLKKDSAQVGGGLGGVNSYMWRAVLDVISFMPLQSADAVGGVVITDWYEDENTPNERIKANVLISSNELRADALRVKLFKQTYSGGRWKDADVSDELERKLEDKILTRAREIKIDGDRTL